MSLRSCPITLVAAITVTLCAVPPAHAHTAGSLPAEHAIPASASQPTVAPVESVPRYEDPGVPSTASVSRPASASAAAPVDLRLRPPSSLSDAKRLQLYEDGRSMSTTGTVLLAVGVPLGITLGIAGLAAAGSCGSVRALDGLTGGDGGSCDGALGAAVFGGIIAGASVVIGLPLVIGGQRRMDRSRLSPPTVPVPDVTVSAGPSGANVAAGWQF
jgi:hypothetical protein